MTIADRPLVLLREISVDLYRDIHKAIRSELFAATSTAASLDPADGVGRGALARHVYDVVELLTSHAEHEDTAVQPALEVHLPDLAAQVEADHDQLEARMEDLQDLANAAAALTSADPRLRLHRLHLELASFTGAYLAHQDLEERVIMPALEQAVGVEAVIGIHQAIVGSIPPEEMARSLALMLPAMNVEDRTELLGGMQAGAPAEVFDGVWGLASSVLDPCELAALATRLGRS